MSPTLPVQSKQVLGAVSPIMAAVFLSFLVIGLALPVLPLHVHDDLGLGTFIVGLVTGTQFAASLVSRLWAGPLADKHGGKTTMVWGLATASVAGLLYLLSLTFLSAPWLSASVLLLGRGVLGCAESFIITGALAWGLALVDGSAAGRVISWVGTAMYGAFALGAPIGSLLYSRMGFSSIAWTTVGLPVVAAALVFKVRGASSTHKGEKTSMLRVAKSVLTPGIALALSSIGFGAMTAFVTLLFSQKGWAPAWMAFSAFALSFIVARSILGHLPDRMGGAKIALVFVLIEAIGQACIWLAPNASIALVGAVLSGLGYSLVYPGLGVVAVRRVQAHVRGSAMGAYTAFLDLALGIATPLLGLIAGWSNLSAVFLISAIFAVLSAAVCAALALSERNRIDQQEV